MDHPYTSIHADTQRYLPNFVSRARAIMDAMCGTRWPYIVIQIEIKIMVALVYVEWDRNQQPADIYSKYRSTAHPVDTLLIKLPNRTMR